MEHVILYDGTAFKCPPDVLLGEGDRRAAGRGVAEQGGDGRGMGRGALRAWVVLNSTCGRGEVEESQRDSQSCDLQARGPSQGTSELPFT